MFKTCNIFLDNNLLLHKAQPTKPSMKIFILARNTILSEFDSSFEINKQKLIEKYPILNEQRACFVTLNLNGKLRGCIGSLVANKSLLDDVISNAYNAAFSDLRFNRLTAFL